MPSSPPDPEATPELLTPYRPIAWGFFLLGLPLWVAVFLAESNAGAWANGGGAAVMTALGALLYKRGS